MSGSWRSRSGILAHLPGQDQRKTVLRSCFSFGSAGSCESAVQARESFFWRLAILGGLALSLGLGMTGRADHNGPISYVDCNKAGDGRFHFQAIKEAVAAAKEFGTIIVLPCSYAEDELKVTVNAKNEPLKGLTLKSQAGRDKTKIKGWVTLGAKNITFCGFDVDATDKENAIVVEEDNVLVCENKLHNAKGAGLLVTKGADNVVAKKNEIFNNGGEGVKVDAESDGFQAVESLVRSNGSTGLLISAGSDRCLITKNDIALNNADGVMIMDADECTIAENTEIENNKLNGISVIKSNGTKILKNPHLASNKRYGITLQSSDNSEVRENEIYKNDAGGIELKGGDEGPAKKSTIVNNKITNHGVAGAQGILIAGDVEANAFLINTLVSNSIGVCLTFFDKEKGGCTNTGQGRMPGNNRFSGNEIKDHHEQGVRVVASRGRNEFISNKLTGNNAAAIQVEETASNDTFANNQIQDNGRQGIVLIKAKRHIVKDNPILSNGGAGVELDGANDNTVQGNNIKDNEEDGIVLKNGATNNDITNNGVEANRFNGLKLDGAKDTDVRNNKFKQNYRAGVLIQSSSEKVDLDHNTISNNFMGGIEIKDSKTLDVEQNDIVNNIQFGVKACQGVEGLQLDRNWWGDASGPSGAFEGRGNPVIVCTGPAVVFPWLLASQQELIETSVSGFMTGKLVSPRANFDASDKADLRLNFYNMDQNASGAVIVAKYQPGKPESATKLKNVVKVMKVLVTGFRTGTAQVEVEYQDSELPKGVDEKNLCLYTSDGGSWQKTGCFVKTDANIVLAEVKVELLTKAPAIALATGL
jgi:parallel beta-helix repeat protein